MSCMTNSTAAAVIAAKVILYLIPHLSGLEAIANTQLRRQMKRNKSGFYQSTKHPHRFNAILLRAMIVTACLIISGTALVLFAGRNSRAAIRPQQEFKASPDGLWQDVAKSSIATRSSDETQGEVALKSYRTVQLEKSVLMDLLAHAPLEFTAAAKTNPVELTLPLPDGKFGRFRIVESPMLEPDFAAKFPEIKTYSGHGVDDPTATTRLDLTIRGFHAIILSSEGTIFVGPGLEKLTPEGAASTQLGETTQYITYFQRDDPREGNLHCEAAANLGDRAQAENAERETRPPEFSTLIAQNGPRRTYRLAVAATAEYTAQNGPTAALARNAIVTSVNGVNAIYNREINVQLMLINNTNIIYTDPATDPYTTQNTNNLIGENQANLDNPNVLGSANYDIGHVFDASVNGGGAGLARLSSTCAGGQKGMGTTGGGFVGLAAHEMGHQFGASHTFNDNSTGSCLSFNGANQRVPESAYEPGSGSTIMSYGGTCGVKNLQGFRDSYFHVRSLEQIYDHISGAGVGNTCDVETPTGNSGIAISQYSPTFTVPDKTAFRLSGRFDDLDSNAETVTWEEYDLGDASPPEGDNGNRPIFRSYAPTAPQFRTFPRMDYILNNNNNPPPTYQSMALCGADPAGNLLTCLTGESRPETGRNMTFIGTARDNAGAVFSASVQVHVVGGAGPFGITTPNSPTTTWTQGTRQTVVWARGATTSEPINCDRVKISISPNGGISFTDVLAESTPNDGSEAVLIPEGILFDTNNARIKIESVIDGNFNTFFDINDANFTIAPLGVTNTNDTGPGSFRQAIEDANSDPGLTKIKFDIPTAGVVHTISLLTDLPLITTPVDIDGTTQPGYTGTPLIRIDGASPTLALGTSGLTLNAGNSIIRGLSVTRFSGAGIKLQTNGGNSIRNCYIGTDPASAAGLGNGLAGVFIDNTPNNDIGEQLFGSGNVISGNNVGVLISGASATGNELRHNYIGTNPDGVDLGNTFDGVRITGAPNNLIGGTRLETGISFPTGNVISGNGTTSGADGIEISGSSATGNRIEANFIGLGPSGTSALANLGTGVYVNNAPNTTIGGATGSTGNYISGNGNLGFGGIALIGSGSSGTKVQGNYLGTNLAGDAAIPNHIHNVYIESASNVIGGTTPGARNVISGSPAGVLLSFGGATGNIIQGNYIGTDASGTVALSVSSTGIAVRGANNNLIGGTTAATRNIISGNGTGIHAVGGTANLLIQGNYIGTNPAGTAVVGNRFPGVIIENSLNNTIGGGSAGAGNVISGNGTGGFNAISISSASGNTVQGNFIGTNATGDAALGNTGSGIIVAGNPSSTNNIIGGTTAASRNVISANSDDGILISGHGNSVMGNYIGTDASGIFNLGNGSSGILIASGDNNIIGGDSGDSGNLIAFNGVVSPHFGDGVRVAGGFTDGVPHGIGNRITGNSIFSNVRMGIDLVGGTENLGVTGNDGCDADTGANNLQNLPVLSSAVNTGVTTTVQGTLNGAASGAFTIDFYSNLACDASGNGEGRTYLGSTMVNTDAGCNALINFTLPVGVPAGLVVTATATDSVGNTSEFSSCVNAQGPTATPTPTPSPTPPGSLQFSAANYDGAEDCAATVVTVTRTGDSSGAASVEYATTDGTALQRTDYSIALGTLTFAPGETSRSFVVLVTEDSFVEGAEIANISLSNPTGGAVLGAQNTATLTILDDATEPAENPIDIAGSYVCQHYHDFLNREPDPSGLAFWTNEITSCGSDVQCIERKRINVSAAYFLSIEFQQTGYLVYRFYNASLNRSNGLPRYLEFLRDTQSVGRGVVVLAPGWEAQLEANKVALAGDFVTRAEFTTLYPVSQTPAQYVDALFTHAGITPSVAERQAALDEFAGATGSADPAARGRVLRRVTENQTFSQREFNRAFVLLQYFGYLRRNPDDLPDNNLDGYNFWLNKLNQFDGDFIAAEMVKAFITSGEYRGRFR
jgi:hypothetical protein